MTAWPLPRRRWDRLAETAGWGLSGTAVTVALASTLAWAELRAGAATGLDSAILLELDPLPPVAALPAPPPAPPAAAPPPPDTPAPDALPDLPDPAPAPAVPDTAPLLPITQTDAPPPLADPAPPAPVADPAMAEARPRARPARAKPTQPAEAPAVETASSQPPSTAQSRAGAQDARAQWGAAIRKKVERRKAYPKAARGASGEVVVKMTVSRSGALEAVAIARSSGNAALDQAALTAVRRTGGFPAAPDQVPGDRQVFSLPMQFAP